MAGCYCFGRSYLEEVGKHSIMRRTGLPARDLRVLDPLLSYPSSIFGRERAIVINLEHMKAIITATEVLVLNSKDPLVAPFVQDLQLHVSNSNGPPEQATKGSNTYAETMNEAFVGSPRSAVDYDLASPSGTGDSRQLHVACETSAMASEMKESSHDPTLDMPKAGGPKALPLEFKALEVCLESACRCLESETSTLEQEAYPALDELTSKISTLNLERVRQIKSRLVAISGRVQKVRDELEHLLDDDMDMAEMYLTDKLASQSMDETSSREELADDALQLNDESDEEAKSINGKTESIIEFESLSGLKPNIQELEMLLEAYFVQIDGTLNKLFTINRARKGEEVTCFSRESGEMPWTFQPDIFDAISSVSASSRENCPHQESSRLRSSAQEMREYVDDTEDYINIMLDDKQNQLLHMGVMLSTATLILSAGIVVTGIFGMALLSRVYLA